MREHGPGHASQLAAIASIASKIGFAGETLRNSVRQAERNAGLRAGLTTDERAEPKRVQRALAYRSEDALRLSGESGG